MKHGDTSPEDRFKAASRLLETHAHYPMLDWPLRRWLRTGDRNFPSSMLNQNLRTVLQTPFSKIAQIRWIGPVRLEQLVVLLDRAQNALNTDRADGFGNAHEGTLSEQRDTVNDEPGFPSQAAREVYFLGVASTPWWELNDRDWNSIVQLVRYHDLEQFPLGRFPRSLRDLHRSLWQERISNFSQRSFSQLFEMKGYCHVKLTQSVGLIYNLACRLSRLPADSHIQTAVFPTTITEANRWLTHWKFLEVEKLPDVSSILECFVKPLLIQVERDISGRVSAIAKRRIGDGGEPETYREISKDFGVTPNRIRTLIPPAVLVFDVRWPEGRDLLQRFCEQLSVQKKANVQQQLLLRISKVFFDSRKATAENSGRRSPRPAGEEDSAEPQSG